MGNTSISNPAAAGLAQAGRAQPSTSGHPAGPRSRPSALSPHPRGPRSARPALPAPVEVAAVQPHHDPAVGQDRVVRLKVPHVLELALGHGEAARGARSAAGSDGRGRPAAAQHARRGSGRSGAQPSPCGRPGAALGGAGGGRAEPAGGARGGSGNGAHGGCGARRPGPVRPAPSAPGNERGMGGRGGPTGGRGTGGQRDRAGGAGARSAPRGWCGMRVRCAPAARGRGERWRNGGGGRGAAAERWSAGSGTAASAPGRAPPRPPGTGRSWAPSEGCASKCRSTRAGPGTAKERRRRAGASRLRRRLRKRPGALSGEKGTKKGAAVTARTKRRSWSKRGISPGEDLPSKRSDPT